MTQYPRPAVLACIADVARHPNLWTVQLKDEEEKDLLVDAHAIVSKFYDSNWARGHASSMLILKRVNEMDVTIKWTRTSLPTLHAPQPLVLPYFLAAIYVDGLQSYLQLGPREVEYLRFCVDQALCSPELISQQSLILDALHRMYGYDL